MDKNKQLFCLLPKTRSFLSLGRITDILGLTGKHDDTYLEIECRQDGITLLEYIVLSGNNVGKFKCGVGSSHTSNFHEEEISHKEIYDQSSTGLDMLMSDCRNYSTPQIFRKLEKVSSSIKILDFKTNFPMYNTLNLR